MTTQTFRTKVANLIEHAQTLVQQLWQLAAAEIKRSAARAGIGLALLVVAVFGLTFALFFLSLGAWWALGLLIGNAWSGLVIGAVWLVITAALVYAAIRSFAKMRGLPETASAVRDITAQLRHEGDPS